MSVQVLFAQYSKRNNSTSRFTDHRTEAGGQVVVTELSCFLKEGTDSENPVIRIQVNFVPTSFNVCYIYGFHRYYWIRKWEYNRSEWLAYCEIDTLATMREEIRTADFYILRADRNCIDIDDYALDYAYPSKNEIIVITTKDNAYYIYDPFKYIFSNDAHTYVQEDFYDREIVTYAGSEITIFRGWVSFGVSLSNMTFVFGTDYAPYSQKSFGTTTYILMKNDAFYRFTQLFFNPTIWAGLNTYDQNPIQYLKQAYYLPKKIPIATLNFYKALDTITLGWLTNNPINVRPPIDPLPSAYLLSQAGYDESSQQRIYVDQNVYVDDDRYIILTEHPQAALRGKYLNYDPYTKIELVFDGIVTIEIPTTCIPKECNSLHLKFRTDLITSSIELLIYGAIHHLTPNETFETLKTVIFQSRINLGFPIQISQINSDVFSAITGVVEGVLGTIPTLLSVGAAAATGGVAAPVLAAAGGLGNSASSLTKIVSSVRQATIPRFSTSGSENVTIASYYTDPYVRFTFMRIADEDFDETGRIVNKTLKINNMRLYQANPQPYQGYIKCLNGDFKSIYSVHEKEIAKQYLENGFFFEE